jgi:hypothetical protein
MTSEILALVCTIATLCLTLLNIWKGVNHPMKDSQDRITALEERVNSLEAHAQEEIDSFEEQEKVNTMLLKSQWAIMSHLLDSNHTKQLTECRDEAEQLIFKKGGSL